MKKIEKGMPGYIKNKILWQTFKLIIWAAIIIAILMTGLILNDWDRKNVFTVIAIVTVLPAAKVAVALYMYWINRKLSPYEQYIQLKDLDKNELLLSDCAVTSGDKVYAIDFAVVSDSCIYCYANKTIKDSQLFAKTTVAFLKTCGQVVNITVLNDFDKFKDRVKAVNNMEMDKENIKKVKDAFLILVI